MDDVFETARPSAPVIASMIRCKCGRTVNIAMPVRCACGDVKAYWTTIDGTRLKLSEMTLGHLTNAIRLLGEHAEKIPPGERDRIELALDLLYAEVAKRSETIEQDRGIQAALMRSVERASQESPGER